MKRIFNFLIRFVVAPGLVGALVVTAVWGLGFASFLISILVMEPRANLPHVDGIVVLTGGSDRVRTGFELLDRHVAPRLLISGVHSKTTLKDLYESSGFQGRALPCCVDLGFRAPDTVGNANETHDWVQDHHIQTIVLITANYHMPRALFEMKRVIPDVAITPYPVKTDQFKVWTKTGMTLVLSEYHKTWISLMRLVRVYLAGIIPGSQGRSG